MFDEESLKKIDSNYFNIILADDRDVTIQSRNTGHYWYLHCAGYARNNADFTAALEKRGFMRKKKKSGMWVQGLQLKDTDFAD